MPDELHQRARAAGLNISRLAQHAVARDLERLDRIRALDAHLAALESELGPLTTSERAEASAWADRVLGSTDSRRSA